MAILNYQIDKHSECGFILVTDITIYTPVLRDEVGLALFVASGDIGGAIAFDYNLTDLSNPGTTLTPGEWVVATENWKQYDFYMYQCPVWDVDDSYLADAVVYYNGDFYVCISPTTNEDPTDPLFWTLLGVTDQQIFYDSIGIASDDGYSVQMKQISEQTTCPRMSVSKPSCHTIHLTYSGTTTEGWDIIFTDHAGTSVSSDSWLAGEVSPVSIFTVTGDGVFIIKATSEAGISFEFPVYEFCSTITCVTGLIKAILCKCDDPCEEPGCDESTMRKYRDEVNRIIALYYPILAMVNADYIQNMGIFTINQDRMEWLDQVATMIERLNVIANRCGVCEDEDTTITEGCDC